jgi:hypothetical protein
MAMRGALGYPSNSGIANLVRKGPWMSRSGAEDPAPGPGPGLTTLGSRVCHLRSSFCEIGMLNNRASDIIDLAGICTRKVTSATAARELARGIVVSKSC